MIEGKDASVNFIQEAIATANVVGYHKTTEFLIKLRSSDSSVLFQESVELIINEVLMNFKMDKSRLMGRYHDGNCRLARQLCYVLLNELLEMNAPSIASHFKKTPPLIYAEIRAFKLLDDENKYDKITLDRYTKVKNKINNKIKS